MINARGQYQQIAWLGLDAYPVVIFVSYVKVACAGENVANFLVLVQVLAVEHLNLFLIRRTQSLWRYSYFIPVGIVAGFGKRINFSPRRFIVDAETEIEDPECRQFCFEEVFSIPMGKPTVILSLCVS